MISITLMVLPCRYETSIQIFQVSGWQNHRGINQVRGIVMLLVIMLGHLLKFHQVLLDLNIRNLHIGLMRVVVMGGCRQLLVRLIIFIVGTINYVQL